MNKTFLCFSIATRTGNLFSLLGPERFSAFHTFSKRDIFLAFQFIFVSLRVTIESGSVGRHHHSLVRTFNSMHLSVFFALAVIIASTLAGKKRFSSLIG